MTAPLAIDLFCGLGGWTDGLLAEGWRVIGFDIEKHEYGAERYPAQLVLQDVLTIHGAQFKHAHLIVASPPCQEYSYMAMPWSRAKQIEREYRDGTRDVKDLTALFDACFRIQREAIAAAGHHIPLVVENVRGAQEWVGRAAWNFGSFYLWGDVPAVMPIAKRGAMKGCVGTVNGSGKFREQTSWDRGHFDGSGKSFQSASVEGLKVGNLAHQRAGHSHTRHLTNPAEHEGVKQPGITGKRNNGKGDLWFQNGAAKHGSRSSARKAASAMIAKIPFALSRHIAHVYRQGLAA